MRTPSARPALRRLPRAADVTPPLVASGLRGPYRAVTTPCVATATHGSTASRRL